MPPSSPPPPRRALFFASSSSVTHPQLRPLFVSLQMVRPTDPSASGSHLCEEHRFLSVHALPSLLRLPRPSSLTLPGLSPLSSPSPSPSPKSSSPSSAASPSGPRLRLFPPWRSKHNFDLSRGTWPGLWAPSSSRLVEWRSRQGYLNTPLTVVAAGMAK